MTCNICINICWESQYYGRFHGDLGTRGITFLPLGNNYRNLKNNKTKTKITQKKHRPKMNVTELEVSRYTLETKKNSRA